MLFYHRRVLILRKTIKIVQQSYLIIKRIFFQHNSFSDKRQLSRIERHSAAASRFMNDVGIYFFLFNFYYKAVVMLSIADLHISYWKTCSATHAHMWQSNDVFVRLRRALENIYM